MSRTAIPFVVKGSRPAKRFAGCMTREEAKGHHSIPTAALESQAPGRVVRIVDVS